MKKNGKKDVPSGSRPEFEHFSKILMEKMDSTVKTVTEQYGGLVKKIDKIGDDVNELKNDMAIVKPAVEAHSRDIQELKTDMSGLKTDLGGLKKDMSEVKSELHSVNMAVMDNSHRIDGIDKKLDENLENHGKRIKKVEEKVFV